MSGLKVVSELDLERPDQNKAETLLKFNFLNNSFY